MNMRPMGGLVRPPKTPIIIKPPIMSGNVKPPTDFPGRKPTIKPMGGLIQPPTQRPTIKEIISKLPTVLKNKKVQMAAGITAGAAAIATIGTIIANKIKK